MLKNKQLILLIVFVLINIVLDQVSKQYVRSKVDYYITTQLLGPYLTLTKVENTGAFLSLGAGLSSWVHSIFILFLPSIILFGLFVYVYTRQNLNPVLLLAYGCVIGGGVGNLIDRFLYGSVTDFLHIDLGFVRTGIFNLADVSIMFGIGILLLKSFKK